MIHKKLVFQAQTWETKKGSFTVSCMQRNPRKHQKSISYSSGTPICGREYKLVWHFLKSALQFEHSYVAHIENIRESQ